MYMLFESFFVGKAFWGHAHVSPKYLYEVGRIGKSAQKGGLLGGSPL